MTAAMRMMEECLKLVDGVLVVLDARCPRASINKKLAELAKEVPKDLLKKYLQKRKDNIFPVLNEAKILSKQAFCRCGTGIPAADFSKLKDGNIVECESCHRMLYLK